jgi:hypothetical protein
VMNHPIYRQTNCIAGIYPQYTTTKLIAMELVKDYYRLDRLMDELTPQQLLEFATTKVEGYPSDLPLQLVFSQVALCLEGLNHWGFSHGDYHLGNLYAMPPQTQGDKWKIFVCDFGMMMDFPESDRLITVQALLDLAYYAQGDVLIRCFTTDTDEPISEKQMKKAVHGMETVVKKYITEPEEGGESVMRFTIQPNSPTTVVGAITYAAATLGLKMQNTNYWLLLKNFCYAANIGLTLSTNLNATAMFGGHPQKFLKDWVMADLNALDIADLRTYLPEKLGPIRRDDRKQILRALATGEDILPKGKHGTAPGKDARFLEPQRPAPKLASAEATGGDGPGPAEALDDSKVMPP